jgi:hypothetical protein
MSINFSLESKKAKKLFLTIQLSPQSHFEHQTAKLEMFDHLTPKLLIFDHWMVFQGDFGDVDATW